MQNLTINLENSADIDIKPEDIVWFESTTNSMLYDLSNLQITDSLFIVQSRSAMIKKFAHDGKYIGDMITRGQGPGEYNFVGNVWANDSNYCHFYNNRLNRYRLNGEFLGYDSVPEAITINPENRIDSLSLSLQEAHISPSGHGVYFINIFLGNYPYGRRLSYAKNLCDTPRTIPGRRRIDGLTMWNCAFIDPDENRLLYWEPAKDTLFIATPDTVRPLYAFNFLANSIPENIASIPNIYDRIKELDKIPDNSYAILLRNFQIADGNIYFSTLISLKEGYIIGINEKTGEFKSWHLKSPAGSKIIPQQYFKIQDGKVYFSVIDEDRPEENSGLFIFPLSELKR